MTSQPATDDPYEDEKLTLQLQVNGQSHRVEGVWYFESLLNVLRDRLGLYGTKYSCDQGQCGACTVLVDGVAINSCIEPAVMAQDGDIRTIEDSAPDTKARVQDLQEAIARAGDVQCGYCAPGMVMSAAALLDEIPEPTEAQVRVGLGGNFCRCTGYNRVVAAVCETAAQRRATTSTTHGGAT